MNVQTDHNDHIDRACYYLQLANLWDHVSLSLGEDIRERVVTFLFRADFLTADQRTEAEFPLVPGKALNAVRLDNEDVVSFPPFPAPDIPPNMRVSLTRIE